MVGFRIYWFLFGDYIYFWFQDLLISFWGEYIYFWLFITHMTQLVPFYSIFFVFVRIKISFWINSIACCLTVKSAFICPSAGVNVHYVTFLGVEGQFNSNSTWKKLSCFPINDFSSFQLLRLFLRAIIVF